METVKQKRPYRVQKLRRNSRIILREQVISAMSARLKQPGKIALIECWHICRREIKYLSYSSLQTVYRDIMTDMIQLGHAKRTLRNGLYEIIKRDTPYDPIPDKEIMEETNYRRAEHTPVADIKVPIVRPPAKYDNMSREETIEKYLKMDV